MTIFVDPAIHYWRRKKWCHLTSDADSLDELHAFASRLGLKKEWFQDPATMRVSHPHYDITESKRVQAVRLGAIDQTKYEAVCRAQAWRLTQQLKEKDFTYNVKWISDIKLTVDAPFGLFDVRVDGSAPRFMRDQKEVIDLLREIEVSV